jgi:putative membrane-bound dehydrogenase-like protein
MLKNFFLLLLLLVVALACTPTAEKKATSFETLSEDEKRLPENALEGMHVADGSEVELFASEPMVTNPTNISVDHLGRVWVCEAYNYDVPPDQSDPKGDRIIVLEDTDHDGKADKRTVFYQGTDITTPLGIFVSGNDIYVSRSPNVLVFRDIDGDLVADKKDTLFTNLGNKGDHSAHSVFPGPDGKLYFSTGNYAGEIKDRVGNAITDRAGFQVSQKGMPYLGGMIMRFDLEGQNFEVLAHNFRNNYEPCIDSYGNVWQSDNDDDGNESCRINFILPYGNYGFLDEKTKATWTTSRVGIESEVSRRHWHQNDPGVVPNVLITGAGSPAGMTMYEGEQLGSEFFGMPIHAEPYHNSVRAYLVEKSGAGFTAGIKEILKGDDQWFRPVDVATAPDGSLIIADWYDPILGGGAAGDARRGRIYRVSKNKTKYNVSAPDLSTVGGAIKGLKNPNPETRFTAYNTLLKNSWESIPALEELYKENRGVIKARAFWLLAKLKKDENFIRGALRDNDANMRMTAIRFVLQNSNHVVSYLNSVKDDPDTHVQRELISSLRYDSSREAAELWSYMAGKYDGNDRWYLEALGIASDLHADLFFNAWMSRVKLDLSNSVHQDIVWRTRSAGTLPLLGQIILNSPDVESSLRFFRAFDFHDGAGKNAVLLTLLDLPRKDKGKFASLALRQLDASSVSKRAIRNALTEALRDADGTLAFIDLVRKFNLSEQTRELISLAMEKSGTEVAGAAVDQLIRFNALEEIGQILKRNDSTTIAMLRALSGKGNRDVVGLVSEAAASNKNTSAVRQTAVTTLGSSWPGEERLLELVKRADFSDDLKPVAASVLFNVYRSSIQREAAKYLQAPQTKGSHLPSVKELVASNGNSVNGQSIFEKLCTTCHRIKGSGVKFGPELTQIGSKLSKDGLYRAVIYPDEGISHGYSATLVTLKDGSEAMGIVTNETDIEIELTLAGGQVNKYSKDQISKMSISDHSIMPALAPAMSKQELIDLVTFLAALK